jgi:hypothetical protein
MGCNCKNKVNAINEKYGDGGISDKMEKNLLFRLIAFISKIFFGILCGVIIIGMAIPMLLYVTLCLMFGKEAHFRIRDYSKFLNKE